MCGIIGQVNFNPSKTIDSGRLAGGRDQLKHRGPDDAGIFVDGNVGLGFRRLSIIDLSKAGSQPMSNEDGTVWLVFNGEFYNFKEQRDEMIKRGHRFRSKSDTEVIIHLYEEFGVNCLRFINGMFALAIYDKAKKLLILARDRFGVKPLYYYLDRHRLAFASEIKAIIADREIGRELDPDSLVDYFSFGYTLAPNTIYRDIRQLEPAHYMIFDLAEGRLGKTETYWRLEIKPTDGRSLADWQEEFMAELKRAVTVRLVSDVPLGIFLSGGVDSSTIVALLKEQSDRPLETFSIGFAESDYDETAYSRQVARKYGTEHHEFIVKPDAIELLPKLARYYDEPFDDSSAIPTFYLSQLTRKRVTVVLTGDGGDELLAGYPRYRDFNKLKNYLKFLPPKPREIFFKKVASIYPESLRGKRLLYLLGLPTARAYEEFMKNFNDSEIGSLLAPELIGQATAPAAFQEIEAPEPIDLVTYLQFLDSRTYLSGDILTKIDRATMASSLEARSPFLDYRLWELVFSMPLETRFNRQRGKYILKEEMKKRFGADFVYREKMGFGVPLNYWFRGELESYAKDILLGKRFLNRGYFNRDYIDRIFSVHRRGRRDFSRKIWSLLFFEHWCRNWLD